jgi:hypothetical protein
MKHFQFFTVSTLLFFGVGCDTEVNPEIDAVKNKFSFIVNENYLKENQRKWVVIYNEEDSVLAESELVNNQEIGLEWLSIEAQAYVNVHILSSENDDLDEIYEVHAYSKIQPGIWYLNGGETQKEKPSAMGTTNIKFVDVSIYDFNWRRIDNVGKGQWTILNDSEFTIGQHYNPDKLWINLFDDQGIPYYKFIDEVGLNESFEFSLSDFSRMDSFIEYEIPSAIYSFAYLYSDETFENGINPGFMIYYNQQYQQANAIKVYYPGNLFSKYSLDTYYLSENILESMVFQGENLPSDFKRINIEEIVNNNSIINFQSTLSGTADYMTHLWEYSLYSNTVGNRIFRYYNYSPILVDFAFSVPPLPSYFADLNTLHLDLEKLELNYARFYKTDDSNSYIEFIDGKFVDPESQQDFSMKLLKEISYD